MMRAGRTPNPRRRILLTTAISRSAALVAALAAPALGSVIPVKDVTSRESRIRIRVAEAVPMAQIGGYDLQIAEDGRATASLTSDRESSWELHCEGGRVRATRTLPEEGQKTLELREPVTVRSPGGFLRFQNHPYRETLRIYSAGSFCEVVNEAPLEKYLEGVVNAEFNSRWNEEAIEAQVVAARTYALYQLRQTRQALTSAHFDVDATVNDQVYDGSMREDFRAAQAVQKTRGIVLTVASADGKPVPVKAFYHSTCGGLTELPQNVWGTSAAGVGHVVRCPFCADSPRFHWDADLQASDISAAFLRGARADGAQPGWPKAWAEIIKHGTLVSVDANGLDQSGRVKDVATEWRVNGAPKLLEVSAPRFREWIGAAKFRSTAFAVSPRAGLAWHFEGRGNGHGVGMCQWGAKTMGEKGVKMAQILHHYYPDAVLRKLW